MYSPLCALLFVLCVGLSTASLNGERRRGETGHKEKEEKSEGSLLLTQPASGKATTSSGRKQENAGRRQRQRDTLGKEQHGHLECQSKSWEIKKKQTLQRILKIADEIHLRDMRRSTASDEQDLGKGS